MNERSPGAFEAALSELRRKELTSAEVAAWLERRGYGVDDVEGTIERLTEADELDDRRFAQRYADDKRALRGWGSERIREALRSRRIPDSLVELALEGDSEIAQVSRASELLIRRDQPLGGMRIVPGRWPSWLAGAMATRSPTRRFEWRRTGRLSTPANAGRGSPLACQTDGPSLRSK